jgi:hypothetical protein
VFASHQVLLERVVPVHYDMADIVEALDDVASAAGEVITPGSSDGGGRDLGGRATARALAGAVAAGARYRARTGNERLAQLVGQRARDLAAIADMHELRWPYLSDLLTPAAYLVYWGAAARVLPPDYEGMPSAFLRRLPARVDGH